MRPRGMRRLPERVRSLDRVLPARRSEATAPKVSVIVPAYNSEQSGLERMVSSLDGQTMSSHDFEVILVDDGSTDDTLGRLRAFAATRPHFVVHSIPNSGWSSRPRNVALEMARGEYVLFMDHDDEVFPESLARAHACGIATDADVVNAKEVRTRGWSWGWREYRESRTPEQPGGTVPLAPMTPHKFYRRQFLLDHGIRFIEGQRILWEDIHFNVACLAAGARVAVAADYPYYHWVATESNNSATFGRDVHELWRNLAELLGEIDTALSGNPLREQLLTLQMRGRVLDAMGPRLLKRAEPNRVIARDRARELLETYASSMRTEDLTCVDHARIDVLRHGDIDAQAALAAWDAAVTSSAVVEDVHWESGILRLRVRATLVDGHGAPLVFHRADGRWVRPLPPEVAGIVSERALDVTDALDRASFTVSVKGRQSRSTWSAPTEATVSMVEHADGTGHLTVLATAEFSPGATVERDWTEPIWDLAARLEAFGYVAHRPLSIGQGTVRGARSRAATAYRNRNGHLSVDASPRRRLAPATALSAARRVKARADLRSVRREVGRRARRVQYDLRPSWQVKVSVIVAAYNSDQAGLERLMRSLDKQSMPRKDFEVVVVDDGSSDDTLDRLEKLAARRPYVRVFSIPNSGWSGRPRNVGVDKARGTYVLFMDHDDELYPRALERAYAFGQAHGADVVNPKEVRSTGWSWGWDAFVTDVATATWHDPNPLIPMTPHKLYRRRFLLDHGVRFPEGPRVLWEDNYFNVSAYAAGARVAVLARHPIYRWRTDTGANSSNTFARDADEYWSKLENLLFFFSEELTGHPGLPYVISHYMRLRVLSFVGPRSLGRDEAFYETAMLYVERLVDRFGPPASDPGMRAVDRARAELVRLRDYGLQRQLARLDRGVTALPVVTAARWEGAELVITCQTTLVDAAGEPLRFRRDGDRVLRQLPDDLAGALTAEARDVARDLDIARFQVSVKGRGSKSTWHLPGESEVRLVDEGDGTAIVTASATARFDPVGFAREHDLSEPVWDFAARLECIGYIAHRGLRGGTTEVALTSKGQAIAYQNRDGLFSLDVSSAVRSLVESAPPNAEDVWIEVTDTLDTAGPTVVFSAPLPGVHAHGSAHQVGEVVLTEDLRLPAVLLTEDGRALLRWSGPVPSGEHQVRARFGTRTGDSGLVLVVDGASAHVRPA